ncbi:hypothetical protein L218DRAFT_868561, partial [Marasmius fiardii PR-910]
MSSTTVNMLTDSLPTNVPTLMASGKNWAIFKLQFSSAVQGKGKWSHFDGSYLCPSLISPSINLITELKTWEKDEAISWNLLLTKLLDLLALKICHYETVVDAWAIIVREYTEKSAYTQTDLWQEFLDST